jgi:micrococcal nuclease
MARYSRRHRSLGSLIISLLFFGAYLLLQPHSPIAKIVAKDDPGSYSINHFVDGDTIAINMNGKVETIRFVGVDTPETHKPNTPVQCYGPAAANYTKTMIGSQKVRLEADPQSTNRDRYNRLLRYVYLPDGRLLNERIIQTGHGFYYPYFPYSKSEQFKADQELARAQNLGLWGNCTPIPDDKGGYKSPPQ